MVFSFLKVSCASQLVDTAENGLQERPMAREAPIIVLF